MLGEWVVCSGCKGAGTIETEWGYKNQAVSISACPICDGEGGFREYVDEEE